LDKFISDGIFAYLGYQDKIFDIVHSKAMNAALELKTNEILYYKYILMEHIKKDMMVFLNIVV
jgi:hypothetical protein